jgi:phosphoserine phosphatase RsbU/P
VSPLRIAIVDDNPINQMIIEKILDTAGYRNHISFHGAKELFAYLGMGRHNPDGEEGTPDLILLDLMMPGIDGIEACRRIQEVDRLRDIPIIIVTALGDSLKLAEALDAGATDYVIKPVNKVELLARIRVALRLRAELNWHKAKERDMALELDLAKQVQETVLGKPLKLEGLSFEAVYRPSMVLAGDFYSWHPLGEGKYGIILLDMMGHGISSSLMCMYIASALQDAMLKNPDPEEVIRTLNAYMLRLHNKEKWVRYYFTAIYLILDPVKRTVEYVNAGHPEGLLLADGAKLHRLSSGGCAVGFDEPIETEKGLITYEKHMKLLLFTDGFLEACGEDWDESTDKIADLLMREQELGAEEMTVSLTDSSVLAAKRDDYCLVAIESGVRS